MTSVSSFNDFHCRLRLRVESTEQQHSPDNNTGPMTQRLYATAMCVLLFAFAVQLQGHLNNSHVQHGSGWRRSTSTEWNNAHIMLNTHLCLICSCCALWYRSVHWTVLACAMMCSHPSSVTSLFCCVSSFSLSVTSLPLPLPHANGV